MIKFSNDFNADMCNRGFSSIFVGQDIKDFLLNDIIKMISKSLEIPNVLSNLDRLNDIEDSIFLKHFGHVSQRYFNKKISRLFNDFLREELLNSFNMECCMHNATRPDRRFNKKLNKDHPCFYWRLVRPNKSDIGKPHADEQFWKYLKPNDVTLPYEHNEKFKIWIPLFGCNDSNNLKMLDKKFYSNKAPYETILVNGVKKPKINDDWFSSMKVNFSSPDDATKAWFFKYDTIHYAPLNSSKSPRISCEATIVHNLSPR